MVGEIKTYSSPDNPIDGMRYLADWFDQVYGDAGTGEDIVQQDLRKWANELEEKQLYTSGDKQV